MEHLSLRASDLAYLAPELTLVAAAIVMTLLDLLLPKAADRRMLGWLSLLGLIVSAMFVCYRLNLGDPVVLLDQSYRIDDFANLCKLIFLAGGALIVLMSMRTVKSSEVPHVGEYFYLLLPAVLGAMIMVSSGDLITLYIGLELLSITSYILVGMRKKQQGSNEASFKYIVMGGISSAFILYGMSFLYGLSGSTNLMEVRQALADNVDTTAALIYVSFFLLLAGFAFKIAAAPFHMWAPDVYQGAPTPVTAFLATVSKAAGAAMLFRLVYNVFYGIGSDRYPVSADIMLGISILAAAAMIIGNFTALRQKNMKRLLALSGAANAGYLLVPIGAGFDLVHFSGTEEFLYYTLAYVLMNIGALAVFSAVSSASGTEEIKGFAGLYYRAPLTSFAMVILILSLSGIPVTAGFFGKLFILLGALQVKQYGLAFIMILTSVISFYYYFSIIRQMFMRTVSTEMGESKLSLPLTLGITIWVCVIATVVLGLFPHKVINYMESIYSLKDFIIQTP